MHKLDSEINLDFGKFGRWWGRELSALLPQKVRQVFDESRSFLIVTPVENKIKITLKTTRNSDYLGEFALNDLGKSQFRELVSNRQVLDHAEVVIRLAKDYIVAKQIYIPDAAAANLNQVIGFELDRYTPFNTTQVYFDFIVLGKDKINNQLRLLLFLAPKQKLDLLIENLLSWDLKLSCVDSQSESSMIEQNRAKYNLLPEAYRFKKSEKPKVIMMLALTTLLLLFVAVLLLPLWMEYQLVEDLSQQVRKVEKHALKVSSIKKKIDLLNEETNELIANKQNKPSLIEVLNSLSALIKDDTWLTQYKYASGKLQIHGHSPTASALIGSLEERPYFKNTRFISPVTQDRTSGLERFQISMDVTSGQRNE